MSKWIETDRLILRPFRLSDWRNVIKYTSKNEIWQYTYEEPYPEEYVRQLVAQNVELQLERDGFGDIIPVILKPNHTLIGHMIFRYFHAPYRIMEIGFVMDPSHQGHGYAYEASEALMAYGFKQLGLHRIIAGCDARNRAAVSILEKLGLKREGHFKKAIFLDNEWQDQYFYAILEEEYK